MKLKKLTAWSGSRGSKEKHLAVKTNKATSPTNIRISSLQSFRFSPRKKNVEGTRPSKETVVLSTSNNDDNENPAGFLSKPEEEPPCLLFEDNEDEEEYAKNHNNNNNNNNNNTIKNQLALESSAGNEKLPPMTPTNPVAPSTPKKFFPLQEIMIDPLAVPPSPMREPNANIMTNPGMNKRLLDDYTPGMYLNFQEQPHVLGDPVGDIGMQRQLMDAQRLVRIILGKPLKGDQNFLEPNSILQAIRSYALMKAELIQLRNKQELDDGDPPAILQALGSPAATTPSTTQTGAFFSNGLETPLLVDTAASSRSDTPKATSELDQANRMIERLQKQLQTANETILGLQQKMKGEKNTDNEDNKATQMETKQCTTDQASPRLVDDAQAESPAQPIDSGGNDSPQLTKEAVQKKLNFYCHTVNPEIPALKIEEEMRQSLDESDRSVEEPKSMDKEALLVDTQTANTTNTPILLESQNDDA